MLISTPFLSTINCSLSKEIPQTEEYSIKDTLMRKHSRRHCKHNTLYYIKYIHQKNKIRDENVIINENLKDGKKKKKNKKTMILLVYGL